MATQLPMVKSNRRVTEEVFHSVRFDEAGLYALLEQAGYSINTTTANATFDENDHSLVVEWRDTIVHPITES